MIAQGTVMRIDVAIPVTPYVTILECRGLGIAGGAPADRARPGERHYLPMVDEIRPIVEAGQASIVGSDFAVDDELAIYPTPGHTPGH